LILRHGIIHWARQRHGIIHWARQRHGIIHWARQRHAYHSHKLSQCQIRCQSLIVLKSRAPLKTTSHNIDLNISHLIIYM